MGKGGGFVVRITVLKGYLGCTAPCHNSGGRWRVGCDAFLLILARSAKPQAARAAQQVQRDSNSNQPGWQGLNQPTQSTTWQLVLLLLRFYYLCQKNDGSYYLHISLILSSFHMYLILVELLERKVKLILPHLLLFEVFWSR